MLKRTNWDDFQPQPFLIVNPDSGNADPRGTIDPFNSMCVRHHWDHNDCILDDHSDINAITVDAVKRGYNLIIAAGGDGTISGVVNGIIGKEAVLGIVLGIVPAGTGNGLAKALRIPLQKDDALSLLSKGHHIAMMDVLEVDGDYAILNVSSGMSARAMAQTSEDSKQALGMLAYLQSLGETMQQLDTYRFQLCIDGQTVSVDACEVIVSNGTLLNDPPSDIYGARADFFDGSMEIQVIKANRLDQYLSLAWELLVQDNHQAESIEIHRGSEYVSIQVEGEQLPLQMDGDLYGHLPAEIHLHTQKIPILLPD